MQKKMQKGMCLLLSLALLLSGCAAGGTETAAGGDNTATVMRLEKTQGTVGVEDEKNTPVEPRAGMQLYSGYEVGTAEISAAWIALDDTKAIKMDETSTAEILQAGKKLEVKLHQGKLFFNVTEPLAEDETFTIETSTMVTGIRGTCGWMEVLDETSSRLGMLEGSVLVDTQDPETGEDRQILVTAGQILTVVYYGPGGEGGDGPGGADAAIQGLIDSNVIRAENIIHTETGLRVEMMQEDQVPEFVEESIRESTALQERIEADSELSVEEILGQAVEELPPEPMEPETVTEPPATETTPPVTIPPSQWSNYETETWYEKKTVEWTEPILGSGGNPTSEVSAPGLNQAQNPGSGGTGTPGGSGTGGAVTTKTERVTEYRPIIELLPAGNPQYAVITDAFEENTYEQTVDANGNVISSVLTKSTLVPAPNKRTQVDDDLTDGEINFLDAKNETMAITYINGRG